MKKYNKKEKKVGMFSWLLWEIIFIFAISTISIILYDMYINVDVKQYPSYVVEKQAVKVNEEDEEEKSDISEILEDISESIVGISKINANDAGMFSVNSEKKLSLGSGIIVSKDGYILTNEHVSGEKYSKCYVNISGENKEYQGSVVWSDSDIDLAIVKIEKSRLKRS